MPVTPDRFAAMRFVLQHRTAIVGSLTALPILAGGYTWLRTGVIDFAVAGLVLAPIAWLIARVLLELVDLIAETLIPR